MTYANARRPMLAATIEPDGITDLRYPVLLSPKLDGIRALEFQGELLSRRLLALPNKALQHAARALEGMFLDGELILGNPAAHDACNRTTSAVMSADGPAPSGDLFGLRYWVFDITDRGAFAFRDRLDWAAARVKNLNLPWVKFVAHVAADSPERVDEFEGVRLAMGFEGIMIRDPGGTYKSGRSTLKEGGLIKLKRFLDGEAAIIGAVELRKNTNVKTRNALGLTERSHANAGMIGQDTLGTLIVRDLKSGVEFELGTGYTVSQRARLWGQRGTLNGKIVKYRYQHIGTINKPRIPVFAGFRDPIDIG
jgi:DNA ligase-1